MPYLLTWANFQFSNLIYDTLVVYDRQLNPQPRLATNWTWSADFRHKQSGKSMQISGTSVVRVEGNRFVEAWQNWDLAHLQAQLTAQ